MTAFMKIETPGEPGQVRIDMPGLPVKVRRKWSKTLRKWQTQRVRILSPNARVHWREKAAAVKTVKGHAALLARQAMPANAPWRGATILPTFVFGTPGRRDGDNLNAELKPVIDGLVKAGLLVDDDRVALFPPTIEIHKGAPECVSLWIRQDGVE